MDFTHRPRRLAQVMMTCLLVFGLAVAQPVLVGADEGLGETAIDAAFDELAPDPPAEEAPPPDDTQAASEAPPAESAPDSVGAGAGQEALSQATEALQAVQPADAGGQGTSESTAPAAADTAPAGGSATDASGGTDGNTSISAAQPAGGQAAQPAAQQAAQPTGGDSGGNDRSRDDEPDSLTETAISNVLSGGEALTVDPALDAVAPILGGVGTEAPTGSGPNDGGLREETSEQAADLRAAGNSLRPASHQRADGEARQDEGGTVVVNSLEDSGDEGQIAQHGHIIGGTLCDGSQFWSLDGGGTINANGVNLSANGGTTAADATGGDDNAAGRGGAAGNGGSAGASAEGGIVIVDRLVTGNNSGNQVSLNGESFDGDCGQGVIDGGDATTITNVNISADGGVALADASGGDDNVARGDDAAAGNGGTARASADGGLVIVGELVLGNNEGNQVNVNAAGSGGSGSGGGCLVDGGTVLNETNIDISADGGLALADASGGDDNLALGDEAAAGNGGRARANADGGFIMTGDIITGNNQGNTINGTCGGGGVSGDATGSTMIYGGDVVNETTLRLSADGGVAISDASGGDDNIALGRNGGNDDEAAAGNGGRAVSNAGGGVIWVGDIVTGNNTGNVIAFGANLAPVPDRDGDDDKKEPRIRRIKQSTGPAKHSGRVVFSQGGRVRTQRPARTVAVGKLPNTGTGPVAVAGSEAASALLLAGLLVAGMAAAGGVATSRRRSFSVAAHAGTPLSGRVTSRER